MRKFQKSQTVCMTICLLSVLFLQSCINSVSDDETENNVAETRTFTLKIKECERDETAYTRAELSSNISYLTLVLFDAEKGSKVKEIKQDVDDPNFGTIECELPLGKYKMVVLGTQKNYPIVEDVTNVCYESGKVTDTYYHYEQLTISATTPPSMSLTLVRPIACFELVAKGAIPENMATMEFVFSGGGNALNAETGYATAETDFTISIDVPAKNIGGTNKSFKGYIFLRADEAKITVKATAKDKDGNDLYTHTFTDIRMKRKSVTQFTGNFFAVNGGINITVDSDWETTSKNDF